MPDEVDDDQAAALLLQGLTAMALVRDCARIEPGETIVVEAAAGGTGSLSVQLAKAAGAKVIGLASSEEKRALVERLGADATVDSRSEDLGAAIREANDGERVDAVLHMSGGEAFDAELGVLAPLGRMVVFGIASREQRDVSTAALLRGSKAVIGFWLVHLLARRELVAPMIGELLGAVAAGELEVTVGERLSALRGRARARRPDRPPHHRQAPLWTRAESEPRFKDLGLAPEIQQAIDELGFDEPTPIQEQAIPELLGGHDVIGQAQTGTGKTAAFGLPLLQYLDPDNDEVQAVVLTPTRELCIQVTQALRAYAEHLDVEIVAVFGGAPIKSQQAQLRAGAHVVVATVGRMMDLMSRRSLVLTAARYVVLDEADEMLDLGFIEDVEKILRMCPSGRQTALFSATMPPPVKRLAESYMYDPTTISITPKTLTVDAIAQAFVEVPAKEKAARLVELLKTEEPEQAIIFCRTKIGASKLEKTLKDKGLDVKALHGDLSQGVRDGVMIAFKDHRVRLLVATDIAARGLDIEHVTHVINYDVPASSEVYVHRIGRTGRVGRTGRAITLVTPAQRDEIDRIERDVKTTIGEWESPEERLEHAPRPRRRERRIPRSPARAEELRSLRRPRGRGDDPRPERGPRTRSRGDRRCGSRQALRQPRRAQRHHGGGPALGAARGRRPARGGDPRRPRPAPLLLRRGRPRVKPSAAVEFLDGTKLKGKEIRLEIAKS